MGFERWGVVGPCRVVGGSCRARRQILEVGNRLVEMGGGERRLMGRGRGRDVLVRGVGHRRGGGLVVGCVEHVLLLVPLVRLVPRIPRSLLCSTLALTFG